MSAAVSKKLDELIHAGFKCESFNDYRHWRQRVFAFLDGTFTHEAAKKFGELDGVETDWWADMGMQIGMLEGMMAKLVETDEALDSLASPSLPAAALVSKRVFIVHGHDHGTKETVARYLERLALDAIILHEKPSESRTVIEKIEAFSDVGFSVALLTPDDLGAVKDDAANLKPRARQSMILELGYFLGRLKRKRVCALYKTGVEIPSDYQGILFIELDEKGAWRTSLAQELSNARLPINVAGLIGS